MASVNKVILIGNLGADPEIRFLPSGQPVANLRLATNEKWKGQDGNMQERTEWHRVVVFGKQAELCKEYLSKGRQVYLEGRIQTRKWNDKEGRERFTTEIVAQNVRFLGGRGEGGERGERGAPAEIDSPDAGSGDGPAFDSGGSEEDVPF